MSEPTKRGRKKTDTSTNEAKPAEPKTPQTSTKGAKPAAAKAQTSDSDGGRPPLPTLKPVGKPEGVTATPSSKTPASGAVQAATPGRPNLPSGPSGSPPAFPPPRPPSGLFGSARPNARVTWEILPSYDAVARIDVTTVPIELLKLVGIKPPSKAKLDKDLALAASWKGAAAGTPDAVAQVISDFLDANAAAEAALKARLDAAWAQLSFRGAALLHNWREEAKVAFSTRLRAVHQPATALRATDPLLILNILSRARSSTLIANMPAALEKPFLERQVFSDDPRVVEWVKSSGCIEQILIDPPSVEDEPTAEE